MFEYTHILNSDVHEFWLFELDDGVIVPTHEEIFMNSLLKLVAINTQIQIQYSRFDSLRDSSRSVISLERHLQWEWNDTRNTCVPYISDITFPNMFDFEFHFWYTRSLNMIQISVQKIFIIICFCSYLIVKITVMTIYKKCLNSDFVSVRDDREYRFQIVFQKSSVLNLHSISSFRLNTRTFWKV